MVDRKRRDESEASMRYKAAKITRYLQENKKMANNYNFKSSDEEKKAQVDRDKDAYKASSESRKRTEHAKRNDGSPNELNVVEDNSDSEVWNALWDMEIDERYQ